MSDRIRLLMTIADLYGGGTERVFSNLLHRLSRDKFDIHVCLWRPVFDYPCPDDLPVHILGKYKPWHALRTVLRMRRLIDDLNPDVIFSALRYTNILTGEALARSSRKPRWVCRLGGAPQHELKGPMKLWARRALGRASRVVCNSKGIHDAAIKYLPLDPERVVTIYNLVEFDRIEKLSQQPLPIKRPSDTFVVLHAGRFHPQKNQSMLLRAFSHMQRKDSELWICGRGELERKLKALSSRLGIGSRVRWLGFQKNPFPFFRAADCFALTSNREGLNNALIESMYCGTPAVSTRCPYGTEEIIQDGATGILTPLNDVAAFSTALDRIAAAGDLRARMAENAYGFVHDTFNPGRICVQFESLFEELARNTAQ